MTDCSTVRSPRRLRPSSAWVDIGGTREAVRNLRENGLGATVRETTQHTAFDPSASRDLHHIQPIRRASCRPQFGQDIDHSRTGGVQLSGITFLGFDLCVEGTGVDDTVESLC